MKNVTLRIPEDMVDDLDHEAEDQGQSRSEYIREILASRHEDSARVREYERKLAERDRECEQLQSQVDDLQTDVERLQNEKRLILEEREEKEELVEYVESEKSLTERKASAGVFTRTRWWLFGMDES